MKIRVNDLKIVAVHEPLSSYEFPPLPIKGLLKETFRVIDTSDVYEATFIFNG